MVFFVINVCRQVDGLTCRHVDILTGRQDNYVGKILEPRLPVDFFDIPPLPLTVQISV